MNPPPVAPGSEFSYDPSLFIWKMQANFFEDAFDAFSPLPTGSPPANPLLVDEFQFGEAGNGSPERRPTASQNLDIDSDRDFDNEDGLGDGLTPADYLLESEDGSFGDDEQVVAASEQHSWKIDHAKGDHRLKGNNTLSAADRKLMG